MYERFRQLMANRGVTPYRISKETGVAQSVLSTWESGKHDPSLETLQLLADYFGVSLDYLSGRSTPPTDLSRQMDTTPDTIDITEDDFTYAMYNEGKELTPEQKQSLLDMARFLKSQQCKEDE